MKSIQPIFLLFAVLAAACIMSIGIFIAERSILGVFGSVIVLIVIMGVGFTVKRNMRKKNLL